MEKAKYNMDQENKELSKRIDEILDAPYPTPDGTEYYEWQYKEIMKAFEKYKLHLLDKAVFVIENHRDERIRRVINDDPKGNWKYLPRDEYKVADNLTRAISLIEDIKMEA